MTIELFTDARFLPPYALSAFVALCHKGVQFALRPVNLEGGEHRGRA